MKNAFSGMLQHCIRARTRNNGRRLCNPSEQENPMSWLLQTWQDVASTCKTSVSSSTSRWLGQSKPTCTESVESFIFTRCYCADFDLQVVRVVPAN